MFPIGEIKLNGTTESDKHTLRKIYLTKELKYHLTTSFTISAGKTENILLGVCIWVCVFMCVDSAECLHSSCAYA